MKQEVKHGQGRGADPPLAVGALHSVEQSAVPAGHDFCEVEELSDQKAAVIARPTQRQMGRGTTSWRSAVDSRFMKVPKPSQTPFGRRVKIRCCVRFCMRWKMGQRKKLSGAVIASAS
jgi:hypothetical protein